MRVALAAIFLLMAASAGDPARADPYRWCAVYGGSGDDTGTNCYFLTLEQCRAAVSGVGGFCNINQFYTGVPAERAPRRRVRPPR